MLDIQYRNLRITIVAISLCISISVTIIGVDLVHRIFGAKKGGEVPGNNNGKITHSLISF